MNTMIASSQPDSSFDHLNPWESSMSNARTWFSDKLRQPSTLMALGCLLGAVVYWVTKSAPLALVAISIIPGALNDHTQGLMNKVEAVEDGMRQNSIAVANANRRLMAIQSPTFVNRGPR